MRVGTEKEVIYFVFVCGGWGSCPSVIHMLIPQTGCILSIT